VCCHWSKLNKNTKMKYRESTRESLRNLRLQYLSPDENLVEEISQISNKEKLVHFLKTGEDCVINEEEISEASFNNIPAYELLSSDNSE
ncbi:MAG: hypothetical protein MHPSP_000648, partial [Paramarteilia canceri]